MRPMVDTKTSPGPAARAETIRASLAAVLRTGFHSLRDLSIAVGVSEKVLDDHLRHLARSTEAGDGRFVIEPAECRGCGFVFESRKKLTKPSRCPECRGTRVRPSRFRID